MTGRRGRVPRSEFHPGGEPGKLHRELGIAEGRRIPAKRLATATHARNPEIRRDALRAATMKQWNHRQKKRTGGRAKGGRPQFRADKPRRR